MIKINCAIAVVTFAGQDLGLGKLWAVAQGAPQPGSLHIFHETKFVRKYLG